MAGLANLSEFFENPLFTETIREVPVETGYIGSRFLPSENTTSAVDMETEKQIQHSLKELDFPCTKVIIAQRISTTRDADRIIVLQDGYIKETGTHEELLAKKGYYYELIKLQTGLDEL